MPLRDALGKLSDRLEAKIAGNQQRPPPIPYASKPNSYNVNHPQPQQYSRPPQHSPIPPNPFNSSSCYWSPDFIPSVPITTHFRHETGQTGWGNNEAQNYTDLPENSFTTPHGQLVLRAIANSRAPDQARKYTSARLTSHQRLARQSGCLTVRLTSPCARGVWPAFWLLPAEPFRWPEDGEVDIFEAWNADPTNHTCLHWGFFTPQDAGKHRVVETPIPDLARPDGKEFAFAWQQGAEGRGGRMVWYIDGRAVMKATIPDGTRRIDDWRIVVNVAMGGNVCQGVLPADGYYDLVIHSIKMLDQPPHGWHGFEGDWRSAREGHGM